MPSTPLSEYLTRVRQYLQEPDPTTSHWTDDFLKNLFNAAYRKRCADLALAHEGYFTIVSQTPLVANQAVYNWPQDFERLIKLEIVRSGGETVPLRRFERHAEANFTPIDGGDTYCPTFRPRGNGFVLEPAPSTAESTLQIEYIRTPPRLANDSDTILDDFPGTYEELLVMDTAVMALDAEGSLETGAVRALLRQRAEWELNWTSYIESRMVKRQAVSPFIPSYWDY